MSKYLVSGGGGFVGKAICQALRELNHEVISVARGDYPELLEAGINHIRLDLSRDKEKLIEITKGVEAVFHVAAKVDMWGRYEDFYAANVIATRNVIAACRASKVNKLIFTSSPSVIADGSDLLAIDESYPYPKKYMAFYPQTKAQAEREVLGANDDRRLMTVALRPHLIWGKGDTNLIPTILEKARAGKLMQVGKGENLTDLTYIEDCVQAHLCALKALDENPSARGKVYFISQGDPQNMWTWINQILELHEGRPRCRRYFKNYSRESRTAVEQVFSL